MNFKLNNHSSQTWNGRQTVERPQEKLNTWTSSSAGVHGNAISEAPNSGLRELESLMCLRTLLIEYPVGERSLRAENNFKRIDRGTQNLSISDFPLMTPLINHQRKVSCERTRLVNDVVASHLCAVIVASLLECASGNCRRERERKKSLSSLIIASRVKFKPSWQKMLDFVGNPVL